MVGDGACYQADDIRSLESTWSEKSDSSKLSSDLLMYREDMHLNPQIKTQKLKVEAQYLMFSSASQDDKREVTNLAASTKNTFSQVRWSACQECTKPILERDKSRMGVHAHNPSSPVVPNLPLIQFMRW